MSMQIEINISSDDAEKAKDTKEWLERRGIPMLLKEYKGLENADIKINVDLSVSKSKLGIREVEINVSSDEARQAKDTKDWLEKRGILLLRGYTHLYVPNIKVNIDPPIRQLKRKFETVLREEG